MSFNVDKCSVMHIGQNNMQNNYNMSNQQLPTTDQQRELGIIITKDLKRQKQTAKAAERPTEYWCSLPPNFSYINKELIFPLYKSLARPHIEHSAILVFTFKARH